MKSFTLPLVIAALAVAGCGRLGDSVPNPFRGLGARAPVSITPEGGFANQDARPSVPMLAGARWEALPEGRLLVVQGMGPVKGFHSAALVTQRVQPGGRLAPDDDGVLRLRFVAVPPPADSPAAALRADPERDMITVARPISFAQLNRIAAIEITGGDRVLRLSR
ncbi:MAG: hypothetical protein P3W94_000900 [Paracoccus sp. (in: a-proteobacteria)]|nr:hypothetical protein [Paracoccus sp. (in: a-proteobacteria)]